MVLDVNVIRHLFSELHTMVVKISDRIIGNKQHELVSLLIIIFV